MSLKEPAPCMYSLYLLMPALDESLGASIPGRTDISFYLYTRQEEWDKRMCQGCVLIPFGFPL